MESGYKNLLYILKHITDFVRLAPFIYSAFFLLGYTISPFCNKNINDVLASLFYISPFVVLFFLIESNILHFCKWHKRACCILLFSFIANCINVSFINISSLEFYIYNAIIVALTALLLLSAYHIFINPKQKDNGHERNLT